MQTRTIRRVAAGSVSAIALSIGFAVGGTTPAAAQTEIYAGGATLPAQAYRKIFNCYSGTGTPRSVDVNNVFDAPQCTAPVNAALRFGNAQVGSGGGLDAFIFDSSARLGIPAAATNTVPYTTSTAPIPNSPALPGGSLPFSLVSPTGYPQHHWSGSDAVLVQTAVPPSTRSYDCYNGNTAAGATCTTDRRTIAGPAIQVPTMTTTVNIPFRLPGRTTLKLSENSLCGIFTGTITNWNDPSITADNGGSVTGGTSRQIRVIVRADSSGTTFLFTNHLEAVCDGTRGANWTGGVSTTATWTAPFFYKATGSEGVAQAVSATAYAIAYVTPDLTQPGATTIVAPANVTLNDGNGTNPITIAAGSYAARPRATLRNKSGAYKLPTPTTGRAALGSATPPTGAAAANAANWGVAGLVPDPVQAGAYPIAGFTWFNGYTCYATNAVGSGLRTFFGWYTSTTNTQLTNILNADQFGRLPANWQTATRSLVFSGSTTKISGVTEAGRAPICTGKTGA